MKKHIKFLIISALIIKVLSPEFTYAQQYSIRGRVCEAAPPSQPIVNAQITIRETGEAQVTDSLGAFIFPSLQRGVYTLTVSHPAYTKAEVRITLDETLKADLKIELQPFLYRMPAVIVQSARTSSDVEQSPYPTIVLEGNRILDSAPQTLSDAISQSPGVALSRDGKWGTTVNIRGLSRYDVVVLNDNIRIETAQDLAAGMSLINPYDIDRIEIVKGPSNASAGTIGGVVQCISKTPSFHDQFTANGEAMVRYESVNNMHGEYLATELSTSSFRFRGSGLFRKACNYDTPDGEMPNSQFTDFGGSFFAGAKLFDTHLFNVTYQRFQAEDAGIPGGKSIAPQATATYKLARRELIKADYSIPNISQYIPLLTLNAAQQTIQRNVQIIASPTMTKTPHAEHTMTTVKAEASILPAKQHSVALGIEAWKRTIDSKRESYDATKRSITLEVPLPEATFESIGFFLQDEWQIIPSLTTLTLGGRYDAIEIKNPTTYDIEWVIDSTGYKSVPASRKLLWNSAKRTSESWNVNIGIHQHITSSLNASFLAAAAERSATVEERFQFLSLGRNTFLGNPDLASERSYHINGGIHWQHKTLSLHADVYSHFFTDLISDTLIFSNASTQTFSKYNIHHAKIYGYEVTSEWNPFTRVLLHGSLSYTRGEDYSHHTNLQQIPPLRGIVSAQYFIQSIGGITIEWEGVATQEQIAAATAGEIRTGGYSLFHCNFVSAPLQAFGQMFTLRAGVHNIFNRAYRDHLSTLRILKLEPGRNLWISLSME